MLGRPAESHLGRDIGIIASVVVAIIVVLAVIVYYH
jgi:tetrahydromethanopterin S-methyltransferase subunit G